MGQLTEKHSLIQQMSSSMEIERIQWKRDMTHASKTRSHMHPPSNKKKKIFPETLKNQLTISIELKDDHHWEVFQILLTIFGYTELIPNPYGTLRNTPLLKELNWYGVTSSTSFSHHQETTIKLIEITKILHFPN